MVLGTYFITDFITAWGTQCTEETATDTGFGQYGNAIARNIKDFKTSANQNKGYYIGRFEAGNASDTLVCKAGQTVWKKITQPNASTASKNMYNDGYATGTFSSDLINSYARDTAIIFIQTFGGESEYYKQNKSTSFTTTGGNGDEYCNINDMSGNAWEVSTELEIDNPGNCFFRGGYYSIDSSGPYCYTSFRGTIFILQKGNSDLSFRPILYVAL